MFLILYLKNNIKNKLVSIAMDNKAGSPPLHEHQDHVCSFNVR